MLLILVFFWVTPADFYLLSLSIKASGSALFRSPMKSDEFLQWLKSYDLSHCRLNQTPGTTAQSKCCFGSALLKSPCRCSTPFTVALVAAIIVKDRKCPCSGLLLAASDDKSVPFTRHRKMSTSCKPVWFWGVKSHHRNKQNLAVVPEAFSAWHTMLSGFTRCSRSPHLDSAAHPVLSFSLNLSLISQTKFSLFRVHVFLICT